MAGSKHHTTEDEFVSKIFSSKSLPPLFCDGFGKGNLSWKRLENVDFDCVGRILTCHLLIESHLNKLIELRSDGHFDFDYANLNFSQKLRLMRNEHAFKEFDFYQGITIVNKIRNKFSHHIEAQIDKSEIGVLRSLLTEWDTKKRDDDKKPVDKITLSDFAIIESFTMLFCSYIAGYCSALITSSKEANAQLLDDYSSTILRDNGV